MTNHERKLARIHDTRTIADAWVLAVNRHLTKWSRSHLLSQHLGYAVAAFKQGMNAETCAHQLMNLERRILRTAVEPL